MGQKPLNSRGGINQLSRFCRLNTPNAKQMFVVITNERVKRVGYV